MLDLIALSAKAPDMGTAGNLEKYAGNVTLSGLLIVFAMLVLLVVIISLFGSVMDRLNGVKKPKASKSVTAQAPAEATVKSQEPQFASVNEVDDGEVIAAISAAVMMMYEGTGKTPVIRSIRPATASRSAWKQAGVLNNVRSF